MTSSSPDRAPQRSARPRIGRELYFVLLLLGLFALGILGLALAGGWEESWRQVMRLSLWQLGALLALSLVNYLFRGLRWHLFARRLGLGLSARANMRHFLGGFAMTVTPGRVGELVRMRWISREAGMAESMHLPFTGIEIESVVKPTSVDVAAAVIAELRPGVEVSANLAYFGDEFVKEVQGVLGLGVTF